MNRRAAKAAARAEFARRMAQLPDPLADVPPEYRHEPWTWHDMLHTGQAQAHQRKNQRSLFSDEQANG